MFRVLVVGGRIAIIALILGFALFFTFSSARAEEGEGEYETDLQKVSSATELFPTEPYAVAVCPAVSESLEYNFNKPGILYESGSMAQSSSPYFWLNSGAKLHIENGIGRTIFGSLPSDSEWRALYRDSNARDTDDGFHPQNIFRLVTKSQWRNFTEQFNFKISKVNLSASPERNAWSGVLTFLRYKNGQNLYYAGVRMDGQVVIKKKKNGSYDTMAAAQYFTNGRPYNRTTNPNLLPLNKWIGIKAEVLTLTDGIVMIRLFIAPNGDDKWQLALEARDDGKTYNGATHDYYGYSGIRTDFMDVSFDDLRLIRSW